MQTKNTDINFIIVNKKLLKPIGMIGFCNNRLTAIVRTERQPAAQPAAISNICNFLTCNDTDNRPCHCLLSKNDWKYDEYGDGGDEYYASTKTKIIY